VAISGITSTILGGALVKDATTDNMDLVLVDASNPSNLWTLLGNGDGTFQTPTSIPLSNQLAWSDQNGNNNSNGYGNFTVPFADFKGDGQLHFAGVDAVNNYLWVYSLVSGTYVGTQLTTEDLGYDSCFNAAGNLSSTSGPPDLVSANCWDDNITVYVNNGSGGFATGVYYPVFGSSDGVTVADVNGDGKNDIVSVNVQSADVAILLGNGDGTVQPELGGFVTGGRPQVPALVTKLLNDTNMDVVVPDNEWSFAYLKGNGNGTFGSDTRSGINYYAPTGNGLRPQGYAIASGDFNGDGIPDFVIGNTNLGTSAGITVFLSNPDGTLKPGVNYFGAISTSNLEYVAVADFNHDGILDIAATDSVNGGVQIFLGNGDGTFTVGPTFATDIVTSSALGIAVADFNGDGLPDIAVVNNVGTSSASVGVLLNNSSGPGNISFVPVTATNPLSTLATEIAAGSLVVGGKIDLVVPLYGTSGMPGAAVAILPGNGDGTFGTESDVPLTNTGTGVTYYNPYAVAIGDLNGDGIPDLAVTIDDQATPANQGIALLLGSGNRAFGAPTFLPTTLQDPTPDNPLPGYVKIADMNGDGIPDLVYSNGEFGTVGILYGQGSGAFYDPVEYPAGRWAFGIAVVGLNGNGARDVVASGNSSDFSGVTVLLNTGDTSTSVASSATTSVVGTSVTFTATVAATVRGATGVPTGTVSFYDGSTLLGHGTLSSGTASLKTTSLTVGSHNITAVYNGDGGQNFLPSTSSVLVQVVEQGTTTTALTSSENPVHAGQSLTFTATVTSTDSPLAPTGNVTFEDNGKALGTGTLNSSGQATLKTSFPVVGQQSITAVYGGDVNFVGSTSSPVVSTVISGDAALGEQADYFGEGKADFTVWRPPTGMWYSIDGSGHLLTRQWGLSTDIPLVGDYDGDGKTDIAVWRPSTGMWYVILSSTGKVVSQQWGEKGDIPVPGDYDGDGKTDYAVWRPSNGTWYIIQSSTGKVVSRQWGEKGDIPVPGDYDGDGKTDIAVWRPSTGMWYVILSSTGKVVSQQWGLPTDKPVPGDYDGDGKTDIAVWRPSTGMWYVMLSSTGKVVSQRWGITGDIPVPRDYDGDDKTDYAVWRPSNGTWYVIESSNGKTISQHWGISTDIPINKPVGQ
jgi:hypothetical protein